MKIIITPAKRMKDEIDYFETENEPVFLKETEQILNHLKTLDVTEIKEMLKCSEAIAIKTYNNYQSCNLYQNTIPALLAYEGIQYDHTAAHILTIEDYEYTKKHLLILSGFYGVLRPFDGVVPYRLELNNKISFDGYKSLYEFWGNKIYQEIINDDHEILDLGAKQYTRIIKKYLTAKIKYVKCCFMEESDNGYKEIGVYVKQARGRMVRYLIENKVTSFEKVKDFNELGYEYRADLSNDNRYIFVRKNKNCLT